MAVRALALLPLLLAPAARAAEVTPTTVVEALHASFLAVMKEAAGLTAEARHRRLEAPVKAAFDLPLMIKVASSGHWQSASDEQRQRLVAAFERMSVGSYARRFDGYAGESFETLREIPTPRGLILVETRIVAPEVEPVPLTYVVKKTEEGGFRIVDVLLTPSVSELAIRRSEYRSVLGRDGMEGLIAALERKADELVSEPAGD